MSMMGGMMPPGMGPPGGGMPGMGGPPPMGGMGGGMGGQSNPMLQALVDAQSGFQEPEPDPLMEMAMMAQQMGIPLTQLLQMLQQGGGRPQGGMPPGGPPMGGQPPAAGPPGPMGQAGPGGY